MTAEGNDPLTKMAIFSHSTHTIFRYFSSLFFSTPLDKFFSDSAGPFTELRSGWVCYFRYSHWWRVCIPAETLAPRGLRWRHRILHQCADRPAK